MHLTNPGPIWVEFSSNHVLIFSNDQSTPVFNHSSLVKARATPDDFSIYPDLIISVDVASCEAKVVKKFIHTGEAYTPNFPLKKKQRNNVKTKSSQNIWSIICSIKVGTKFWTYKGSFSLSLTDADPDEAKSSLILTYTNTEFDLIFISHGGGGGVFGVSSHNSCDTEV